MPGDRILRIIALILLCALVYYFSYDQGRQVQKSKLENFTKTLAAKDKTIESLALELRRCREASVQSSPDSSNKTSGQDLERVTLRPGSSRPILDLQVWVTCLEIDTEKQKAEIKLSWLNSEKTKMTALGLGEIVSLDLNGSSYYLVLSELRPSLITLQVLTRTS